MQTSGSLKKVPGNAMCTYMPMCLCGEKYTFELKNDMVTKKLLDELTYKIIGCAIEVHTT